MRRYNDENTLTILEYCDVRVSRTLADKSNGVA